MMFTLRTLFVFALVSTLSSAIAQVPANLDQSGVVDDQTAINEQLKDNSDDVFKKLFITKRKQHIKAVKNLRNSDSYERKYEMITILLKNMIDIINAKKNDLEAIKEQLKEEKSIAGFDIQLKDALSSILENTAFFGDIVLQLPDITHRILSKKPDWKREMHWSLYFVNETRFLIDETTGSTLDLVFQELNLVERQPNYLNPFSEANQKAPAEKSKGKGKKRKGSGPQMVHVDL